MMKENTHIFQGLKRDTHQIRQDSKFLWNAHNIRLTNREDNTLISLTNEKGTSDILATLNGYYVGHCVLGNYLVVFTAQKNGLENYIYRIKKVDDNYETIILYYKSDPGKDINGVSIGWSPENPIETLGNVETNLIQKVYWIDGVHQTRSINISKPELDEISYLDGEDLTEKLKFNENSFDFIPKLNLDEEITIEKKYGDGLFSPGTIQYSFTYFNKYGQETNIFYTTPIHYISFKTRGGNPEESIANSFVITIENVDPNFEYLRIYSIHRTSLNSTPQVQQLPDIFLKGSEQDHKIQIVDTGTIGSVVDPTKLFYIGGDTIIANTFSQKDGTLFLGNIKINSNEKNILEILKTGIINEDIIISDEPIKSYDKEYTLPKNSYYFQVDQDTLTEYVAGFKTNETYRIGIQGQLDNGTWTTPVHIKDVIVSTQYPTCNLIENDLNKDVGLQVTQYSSQIKISKDLLSKLINKGIKKLRACVVFPNNTDRDILCQGVLNPTVFNAYNRSKNSPYAQASWFFRPHKKKYDLQIEEAYGGNIECRHNYALSTSQGYGVEIQNMVNKGERTVNVVTGKGDYKSDYFVDENIVTLNSPDLELDSQLSNLNWENVKLRILGFVELESIYGDITINTSTPPLDPTSAGFLHKTIGYSVNTPIKDRNNGGLVSQMLYEDTQVNKDFENNESTTSYYIHAFHRNGSLNNDSNRPDDKGVRSAVLETKTISNLKSFGSFKPINNFKFFGDNTEYNVSSIFKITTPQVFNSNEISILKVDKTYPTLNFTTSAIYEGNVETLVTTNENYPIRTNSGTFYTSKEPVSMKYKSIPHVMFRLLNAYDKTNQESIVQQSGYNYQLILPRHILAESPGLSISYPRWLIEGNPYDYISEESKQENSEDYMGVLSHIGANIISNNIPEGNADNYIGNTNIYCKYTEFDSEGNSTSKILVGNTLFDTNKQHYIISPIVTSSTPKIFKIDQSTYIHKDTWFEQDGLLSEICEDVGWRLTEDGYYQILSPIYVRIDSNGGISKSSIVISTRDSRPPLDIAYLQPTFGEESDEVKPYLLFAELYRDIDPSIKFGGNTEQSMLQNLWFPASDPIKITNSSEDLSVDLKYGDTWYSRYDCLKTYPFTNEDQNQIVEIGSFMCETRINIDGRYDKNKGMLSNLYSSPINFNLINSVYSQKDTFFNYRILEKDFYKQKEYYNQILWSKQKNPGEDIDTWSNITLNNNLNLDGDRGKITSIKSWNEYLLCFQEKALSQILFNSRTQIPVTDGVPIEISNSYKVDGSRVINNNVGCSNKWSIQLSNLGLYFLDSNSNSLILFNGQLSNLSKTNGLDWWFKQVSDNLWTSLPSQNNGIRTFYDSVYGDVYFTPGPSIIQQDSLCYSQQLEQFVSLMSYGGTQAMFNFNDGFYSLRESNGSTKLYQNNVGKYNDFYGEIKGWDFSFIENNDPTYTKIFDTLELRTDHWNGINLLNSCPVNFIRVSNEYQDSETVNLDNKNMRKKFRIWRNILPRNKGTRERIRNMWSKITLGWKPNISEGQNNKAFVHDVTVKYTI